MTDAVDAPAWRLVDPSLIERVTVDSITYRYARAGRGQPIVLMHGSAGSLDDWSSVIPALLPDYDVIAFDRPGHGYSGRPAGDIGTPAAQAVLLARLLEVIGVNDPIVVGHSWSGALAVAYDLAFPGRARGLVLVEPTVYRDPSLVDPVARLIAMPVIGPLLAATVGPVAARSRIARNLATAFAPDIVPPAYLATAQAMWTRPGQLRAIAADTIGRDASIDALSARYSALTAPRAMLVSGADAFIDPARQALRLAREHAVAEVRIVPGAGHQLPITHPHEVAEIVRRHAA